MPWRCDVGAEPQFRSVTAQLSRRWIRTARRDCPECLCQRVDVGQLAVRGVGVPAHLGCHEVVRPERVALPGDLLLLRVLHKAKVTDHPLTVELEQVVGLDVAVRDPASSQAAQGLGDSPDRHDDTRQLGRRSERGD